MRKGWESGLMVLTCLARKEGEPEGVLFWLLGPLPPSPPPPPVLSKFSRDAAALSAAKGRRPNIELSLGFPSTTSLWVSSPLSTLASWLEDLHLEKIPRIVLIFFVGEIWWGSVGEAFSSSSWRTKLSSPSGPVLQSTVKLTYTYKESNIYYRHYRKSIRWDRRPLSTRKNKTYVDILVYGRTYLRLNWYATA